MLAHTVKRGDMWLCLSCGPSIKMGIYVHSTNVNCVVLSFVRDAKLGPVLTRSLKSTKGKRREKKKKRWRREEIVMESRMEGEKE